jgi:hypothetical protein
MACGVSPDGSARGVVLLACDSFVVIATFQRLRAFVRTAYSPGNTCSVVLSGSSCPPKSPPINSVQFNRL